MNTQQPYQDADIVLSSDAPPWPASSIDDLVCAYQSHAAAEQSARIAKLQIAAQLASLAPMVDSCRTVRLRGEHRRIKLEYPEDSWDQPRLKEAWNAYPRFRDEFLSISSLRVRLREYRKAQHETGPADFQMFVGMLADANRGPQGLPRITIE
jgi:hypothetical protein